MPTLADARILVTGGAGFIGSHLVEQLLREPVVEVVVLHNLVRGSRGNLEAVLKYERLPVVWRSITAPAPITDSLTAAATSSALPA